MKIIHFCAGLEKNNGMANVARQFVAEELAMGEAATLTNDLRAVIKGVDAVYVHGTWLPVLWKASKQAKKIGAKLVVVPHGGYDPVRLAFHGWKKRLVSFWEHRMLRRADVLLATCAAEAEWIRAYAQGIGDRGSGIRVEVTDLKRFFHIVRLFDCSDCSIGKKGSLHLLYLGRRHPLKGLEFLEQAVREIQAKDEGELRNQSIGVVKGAGRRVLALRKVEEWLRGVDASSFEAALVGLIEERASSNVYRFREPGERERALDGARRFFGEFSRKIVELSDGRCVYFAPDARSRVRNGDDLSLCWAEYAFHAVSSGGALLTDKGYHERWYNLSKVVNFEIIEKALLAENCVPVLKNRPKDDSIKFFATSLQGGNFDVVVRLDEYGNAQANMTEVTFEVNQRKLKKLPRLVPLAEAVQTVVYHQTTAGSYPPDGDNIAHPDDERKGMKSVPDARSGLEGRVELRIVSDHFGEELEKDWAWCDVLVLPTLSENFGRVVAEALERGKRVITTDGAPVWGEGELFDCSDCPDCSIGYGGRLIYLKGYRNGTDEERVKLLKKGLESLRV